LAGFLGVLYFSKFRKQKTRLKSVKNSFACNLKVIFLPSLRGQHWQEKKFLPIVKNGGPSCRRKEFFLYVMAKRNGTDCPASREKLTFPWTRKGADRLGVLQCALNSFLLFRSYFEAPFQERKKQPELYFPGGPGRTYRLTRACPK